MTLQQAIDAMNAYLKILDGSTLKVDTISIETDAQFSCTAHTIKLVVSTPIDEKVPAFLRKQAE